MTKFTPANIRQLEQACYYCFAATGFTNPKTLIQKAAIQSQLAEVLNIDGQLGVDCYRHLNEQSAVKQIQQHSQDFEQLDCPALPPDAFDGFLQQNFKHVPDASAVKLKEQRIIE